MRPHGPVWSSRFTWTNLTRQQMAGRPGHSVPSMNDRDNSNSAFCQWRSKVHWPEHWMTDSESSPARLVPKLHWVTSAWPGARPARRRSTTWVGLGGRAQAASTEPLHSLETTQADTPVQVKLPGWSWFASCSSCPDHHNLRQPWQRRGHGVVRASESQFKFQVNFLDNI